MHCRIVPDSKLTSCRLLSVLVW